MQTHFHLVIFVPVPSNLERQQKITLHLFLKCRKIPRLTTSHYAHYSYFVKTLNVAWKWKQTFHLKPVSEPMRYTRTKWTATEVKYTQTTDMKTVHNTCVSIKSRSSQPSYDRVITRPSLQIALAPSQLICRTSNVLQWQTAIADEVTCISQHSSLHSVYIL